MYIIIEKDQVLSAAPDKEGLVDMARTLKGNYFICKVVAETETVTRIKKPVRIKSEKSTLLPDLLHIAEAPVVPMMQRCHFDDNIAIKSIETLEGPVYLCEKCSESQ